MVRPIFGSELHIMVWKYLQAMDEAAQDVSEWVYENRAEHDDLPSSRHLAEVITGWGLEYEQRLAAEKAGQERLFGIDIFTLFCT